METVDEVEQAVLQLSAADLALFRSWFEAFDAQVWDEQLASDVAAGRLDNLAEQAIADFRAGTCREL